MTNKLQPKIEAFLRRQSAKLHDRFKGEASCEMTRLGTTYGGWWAPTEGLGQNDVIVSAGAGEDISYDVEAAARFNCKVLVVDPTPRAKIHFDETQRALQNGSPAPINNNPEQCYEADASVFKQLSYYPVGLYHKRTTVHFFPPKNAAHVSHSIGNLHNTDGGFRAECLTVRDLLNQAGIADKDVAIVKLDIEGAEFQVVPSMLKQGIRPRFLMIEFHAGKSWLEKHLRRKTLLTLWRLARHGYVLVEQQGWDYALEYRG